MQAPAMKFDLYDNDGEGQNSTGLFTLRKMPDVPALNLLGRSLGPFGHDETSAYPEIAAPLRVGPRFAAERRQ
jgi:hypothetical protein